LQLGFQTIISNWQWQESKDLLIGFASALRHDLIPNWIVKEDKCCQHKCGLVQLYLILSLIIKVNKKGRLLLFLNKTMKGKHHGGIRALSGGGGIFGSVGVEGCQSVVEEGYIGDSEVTGEFSRWKERKGSVD